MAIQFVQATGKGSESAPAGTTPVTAFTNPLTNPSLIVVCVTNYTSGGVTVSSIADDASNIYARAGAVDSPGGDDGKMEIWFAYNTSTQAANVITVTFGAPTAAEYVVICAAEYTGLATASVYDVSSTAKMDSGNPTTHATNNTSARSQNDEIIVGFFVPWNTAYVHSAGANTNLRIAQNNGDGALADRIVASTATSGVVTLTTLTGDNQGMITRSFKMEGGGAGKATKNTRSYPRGTNLGAFRGMGGRR